MQYLSEFEILSQPIVPAAGIPPGGSVPFVIQGYFCLISRLADNISGDLNVSLTFYPTPAFPASTGAVATDPLIADVEDETGNNVLNLNFANTIVVAIGSGKTVLVGIQPNIANTAIFSTAGQYAVRGYVMIDVATSPAPQGMYQLAVAPEIRATFAAIDPNAPMVGLAGAQNIAYCLPVSNGGLVTLTKGKEAKEKEQSKDQKDVKERKETLKDRKEFKEQLLEKLIDQRPPLGDPEPAQNALTSLSERMAALEALVGGTGQTFISPERRPELG